MRTRPSKLSLIARTLGVLAILLIGSGPSAFAASSASGTYVEDDRFGDYSAIAVHGAPTGSVVTVRQVRGNTWRVHDPAGMDGSGLCSKPHGPNAVTCKTPTRPDLGLWMGPRRDTVQLVGKEPGNVDVGLGPGNDRVDISALKETYFNFLWGGPGDDLVVGSSDDDYLYGRPGDDVVWGGGGDDEIHGNEGRDALSGGRDSDQIDSGLDQVRDEFRCGRGHDHARYGPKDAFVTADCEVETPDAGSLIPDRLLPPGPLGAFQTAVRKLGGTR